MRLLAARRTAPGLALARAGAILSLAVAAPSPVRAEQAPAAAPSVPSGVTLAASLGGGGMLGAGTAYTPSGLFETEVLLGYELGLGIRPEAGVLVGAAPSGYFGLRAGIHYAFEGLPAYARADLDWATPRSYLQLRWLLFGAGLEIRVTDALGLFAEADTGVPLRSAIGVPFELRGGVSVRF